MRRFLAGTALGLLVGLVVGVTGGSQLADNPQGRTHAESATRPGDRATARPDGSTWDPAAHAGTGAAAADAPPLPSEDEGRSERPGRVTRQDPVKRETPKIEPTNVTPPPRPTADLLRELERMLAEDPLSPHASDLAALFANRSDRAPIPFDLVTRALALAEAPDGEGAQVASALVRGISLEAAVAGLDAAIAGDEKLLWLAYELSERATGDDTLDFGVLSAGLMSTAGAQGRSAGVYLSQWADSPPIRSLLRLAESDPDDDTRAYALEVVTEVASASEDPAIQELVVPLILMTSLQGTDEARRTAIEMFEEIGPQAAGTALKLLREGGLDEDLAYFVVRPLLEAGRIADIMRTDVSPEVASSIVWWAEEGDDEDENNADRVNVVVPYVSQLAPLCDEDATDSLISVLLNHGRLEALEDMALLDDLSHRARELALEYLFTSESTPEHMQGELETRALRVLAVYLDPSRSGVERRRRAAQTAVDSGLDFRSERVATAAIALFENAARSDPNSWVRGLSDEAAGNLRTYFE